MPDFRTQEQRLRDAPDAPWNRAHPDAPWNRAHPESLGWWEPVREVPSLPDRGQAWFSGDLELFTGQRTRRRRPLHAMAQFLVRVWEKVRAL